MANLNFRERLFVEYYLGECKGNATESARRAGYTWPDKQGPRLVGKSRVRAAIDARVSEVAMSADEVLARLTDLGAGDLGEFIAINENGGFSFDLRKAKRRGRLHLLKKIRNKIETRHERTGRKDESGKPIVDLVVTEQIELELHDPESPLEKLGRYHGLWKDREDGKEDSGNAPLSPEVAAAMIAAGLEKAKAEKQ